MVDRPLVNALTVDVEDYFQVSNFEGRISRGNWDYLPVRLEESVQRILELFQRFQVRATFFTLGWVAERFPRLLQAIAAAGHEIASHGYAHRIAYDMSPEEFRRDLVRSKRAIEDAAGVAVTGHRATSYSIVSRNLDYLEILAQEGFLYDSSIFPVHHDRYGIAGWDRFPGRVSAGGHSICEFPPSTYRALGYNLPVAGGGYLRLFPVHFISWCIRKINEVEKKPAVIYFHPWELDPGQPRVTGRAVTSFRHYNNISRTEGKVAHLLRNHRFAPMRELLDRVPAGVAP